ncbi:zinc finger C4H2 domain-containing protein isoform X1 [Cimex lectularius]|uniref:C4H2-type domain-containing protein n=1 Tax=Cimex lectularius TaxID=79782 RepID=A0A8I6S154_CIMLE|nr:zinc finger C4H2 domain-containing protein isoform X1 [Cimex lectularius]
MLNMEEHQRNIMAKLHALKEIRAKTIELEKLKAKILEEVEAKEKEEKCLTEYKQEMDLLMQEKMSHVEELRQIHADINAMENVIKKAEEARTRSLDRAKRIHEEYRPLKDDIDRMRRDYLGLERLPELHEQEADLITPELVLFAKSYPEKTYKETWRPDVAAMSGFLHPHPSTSAFMPPLQPPPMPIIASTSKAPDPPLPSLPGPPPTFRQQPPPMKSCLSCHQQIHRNAPICPLCKAKSRSRNPKKPKKKD